MLAALIVAVGFGCASQKPQQKTQQASTGAGQAGDVVASNDKSKRAMVCTFETPSGSHIPEKTCRYQDEVDAQRQETQDTIRAYRNPSNRTGN